MHRRPAIPHPTPTPPHPHPIPTRPTLTWYGSNHFRAPHPIPPQWHPALPFAAAPHPHLQLTPIICMPAPHPTPPCLICCYLVSFGVSTPPPSSVPPKWQPALPICMPFTCLPAPHSNYFDLLLFDLFWFQSESVCVEECGSLRSQSVLRLSESYWCVCV
jgi:hypothetical protein